MNPGVSAEQAIKSYSEAYQAFFGSPAPAVRRLESGAVDVRFDACTKRYTIKDLRSVTAMMESFVEGVI